MVRSGDDSRRQAASAATLTDLAAAEGSGGVVWSVSPQGFHANLVVLEAHGEIGQHRNDSVNVLVVALAGEGTATVEGEQFPLGAMTALLIERGTTRSISAGSSGLRYLSVHAQRGPLTIGAGRTEALDV